MYRDKDGPLCSPMRAGLPLPCGSALYSQAPCSVAACPGQCICRPDALYLQARCTVFVDPVQYICRPCVMYLQALYTALANLCTVFAAPVHSIPCEICLHALCSVFASSVQCICRPCAVYSQPCALLDNYPARLGLAGGGGEKGD